MQATRIRIGTRGSPLALAQAVEVRDRLMSAHDLPAEAFEIVAIRTSGDRIQDRSLSQIGGKGLFTKEIEEALLASQIDLAIHSMKDMPTHLEPGLSIAALLPRADVRDAFISLRWPSLAAMPADAVVGTSSLRRQAQVRRLRPDLRVVPLRGNVDTRLRKLGENAADATLLAMAGLDRLGLQDRVTEPMPVETMLPAVAQGAIGVEIRNDDESMRRLCARIDDAATAIAISAERAFLARLDGSCRTPIAGLATIADGRISLAGQILTPDGSEVHSGRREGPTADAAALGTSLANELLGRAGPRFFAGQA